MFSVSLNKTIPSFLLDMEWMDGPNEDENSEVDLGYLPLMALNNSAPSVKVAQDQLYLKDMPHPADEDLQGLVQAIRWTQEISQQEAVRLLEVKMYPFKNVSAD